MTVDEHDHLSELLVIGGRSGSGKTSTAAEIHHQLQQLGMMHAWIEGDNLDQAYPAPWRNGHDLAEQNLMAMWGNYRKLGYRRLVYTNTVSVTNYPSLTDAMGDQPRVTAILLVASDASVAGRLGGREIGSALDLHLERSRLRDRELDSTVGPEVHRVVTDGRTVTEIAAQIITLTGWTDRSR